MSGSDKNSVTLTTNQLWVLADSLNKGPLPQFLMIVPHTAIFDEEIFQRDIIASLTQAGIVDDNSAIHPLIVSWLAPLCTVPVKVNIVLNDNEHTSRIVIVQNDEKKFFYLAVSQDTGVCGTADIFDLSGLLNFLQVGKYNDRPIPIDRCEVSYRMITRSLEKVIHSEKEYGLQDLKNLIESFHLPPVLTRLAEDFGEIPTKNHTATFLLTYYDGEETLLENPPSMSIISIPQGKLVTYQDVICGGEEIVVYEPGTVTNIQTGLDRLFRSINQQPWFS